MATALAYIGQCPLRGIWSVDETPLPTAATGGWTDPDTLRVDVLFLETPHRLTVTCALDDRTFTARRHTAPLHGGPLHRMRAPGGSPLRTA